MKNFIFSMVISVAVVGVPMLVAIYVTNISVFWGGFILGGVAFFALYCWYVLIKEAIKINIF